MWIDIATFFVAVLIGFAVEYHVLRRAGHESFVLNITRPELLVSIAEQYYNAGSDVVYANTVGANRYKLEECGKSVEELVTAGIVNAKKARDTVKPDGLVALDVGPIGQ